MSYNPPIPQNQYRPYGDFGPICDSLVPSRALPSALLDPNECGVDADCPQGFICVNGRCVPEDQEYEDLWLPPPEIGGAGTKCKVRLLDDGSIEYYDCKTDYDAPGVDPEEYTSECIKINGKCYNFYKETEVDLELPPFDDFEVLTLAKCNPFDPDINIRSQTFFNNLGIKSTQYAAAKSFPVTFPVQGGMAEGDGSANVTCRFAEDGNSIIVGGTKGGKVGNLTLKLEWDDNPNTDGTALGTITVTNSTGDTISFTQSGEEGSSQQTIDIPGESTSLTLTYTNLHPANDPIIVEEDGRKLCLKDGDGGDCNASFTIESVASEAGGGISLWSEQANLYGVWVNPAVCTLPCLEQTVSYQIYFDQTETYHFEFGADDTGEVYFDEETTPFITATTPTMTNPAIFNDATGPTKVSKQITEGTHELTFKVTNNFIQGDEGNSYYFGSDVSNYGIASFNSNGDLVVTGGNADVTFTFAWDDDASNAGLALTSLEYTALGVSFTYSTEEGESTVTKSVAPGTYSITLQGNNGGFAVESGNQKLCFYDNSGTDCNASLIISTPQGGAAVAFQLYSNYAPTIFQASPGYRDTDIAFINQDGPIRWTDTNDDGIVDKTDGPFTADFEMVGGSGTGMILNLTLSIQLGIDAGLQAANIVLNEIVNRGQGYQIGDLLQIPGYEFDIPPVRINQIVQDDWYTNFTSSSAVFIRTSEQPGWEPTGGGDKNEVGGFTVPVDSNTGRYLSFGVVDEEGVNQALVTTRTCSFQMNLTGVRRLTFHMIAGNDANGGERVNNVSESLRFSFDNSSWIRPGVSKNFSGVSRSQYDDKYGNWYTYIIDVPFQFAVENQTLYFEQSISGQPEYAVGYNGMTDAAFTAAYQNGGDVFGIYRVDTEGIGTGYSCDNISEESYSWNKNPGGWYMKICKFTPCVNEENLTWNRVSNPQWGAFLNAYAVWISFQDPGPFNTPYTIRYRIPVEYDDTLTLEYQADNTMTIKFDGQQVANFSFVLGGSPSSTTIPNVTQGSHILEMTVTNVAATGGDNSWNNNPAGGAWLLRHSQSPGFNPFAFSLYTNSNNPDSLPKDQFNPSKLRAWAYNNDGGASQLWYPPDNAGGFDQNGFSGYNDDDGNPDYSSDGFISSSLNEWHYSNDGGKAQLWYELGETVEANYEMTGGSGSGMVLKIELEATAEANGDPHNTRYRVKEVIDPGTGYQAGDVLNFVFFTPRRNAAQLGGYSMIPDPIRLDSVYQGTGADPTDFVEEEFDMIGGTGSGMRLKIRLEPHTGSDGGNNNTKYKIVDVINAGTGYSLNDELYFNFNTPRRISLGLGNTTFTSSGAQDYSVRLDGQIIRTSADLTSRASGPYWNTREAVGYEYTTTVNDNVAQDL
jgi:hypothetical protein